MRVPVALLVVLGISDLIRLIAVELALYDTKTIRGRLYYRLHLLAFWAEIDGKLKAADIYRNIHRVWEDCVIKVSTKTGSKYELDTEAGTWSRVLSTERSGRISLESGHFDAHGNLHGGPITVGESMYLTHSSGGWLRTSPVVSVEGLEE